MSINYISGWKFDKTLPRDAAMGERIRIAAEWYVARLCKQPVKTPATRPPVGWGITYGRIEFPPSVQPNLWHD